MLFVATCHDKPDSAELRAVHRPAHIDYLKAAGERLVLGGPLLAADGQAAIGSLVVVDCADRAAAEAFFAEDPYAKAGMFASVSLCPFRKTLP
jgi:uncharacterized protein YciI